jgi:hypothetical protein
MAEIPLGRVAGIPVTATRSAIITWVALGIALALVDADVVGRSLVAAVLGGIVGVVLHALSLLGHDLGHAVAAQQVGYPMERIRYWGPLSSTLYPEDEPSLPAAIHLRRALGGPIASLLLSVVALAIALAVRSLGATATWLGIFLVFDNFAVLTLGALTPLGFNDGSTILYWWGRRGEANAARNA